MKVILKDTVIIIPTRRPPPVKTLESYGTVGEVIILSDPDFLKSHTKYYKKFKRITVVEGKVGMVPQSAQCYRTAYQAGYKYFFRMDDDLPPKTFVMKDRYPDLVFVMVEARKCAKELGTSLNGFVNTSRRDWLGTGYKRTYGLIHGGANLCISAKDPYLFLDKKLPAYEDVYRTLAHRERDGALGRVAFIGFDKRPSVLNGTLVPKPKRVLYEAKDLILKRFDGMVTCDGFRTLGSGHIIANWRMKPCASVDR